MCSLDDENELLKDAFGLMIHYTCNESIEDRGRKPGPCLILSCIH